MFSTKYGALSSITGIDQGGTYLTTFNVTGSGWIAGGGTQIVGNVDGTSYLEVNAEL